MLLSVITINYNNLDGLKRTYDSLKPMFTHCPSDIEWIIIDGKSTDGSAEFVTSEEFQRIPGAKISEKDSGIYNAMNKGVAHANGEYFLFLNSGDCLRKEVLENGLINQLGPEDLIYGYWSDENAIVQYIDYPIVLNLDFFVLGCLCHQATFFHRRLFANDQYDESYKVAGDLEFIARKICKEKCTYRRIELPICIMEKGGISANRYYELSVPERRRAIGLLMEGGCEWYDAISLSQRLGNEDLLNVLRKISLGSEGLKRYIVKVLEVSLSLYKFIKKIV